MSKDWEIFHQKQTWCTGGVRYAFFTWTVPNPSTSTKSPRVLCFQHLSHQRAAEPQGENMNSNKGDSKVFWDFLYPPTAPALLSVTSNYCRLHAAACGVVCDFYQHGFWYKFKRCKAENLNHKHRVVKFNYWKLLLLLQNSTALWATHRFIHIYSRRIPAG